jgi:hypothetical protein
MAGRTVLGNVALVAVLAAAAAVMSFRAVYEPDLWYHLAQGRENAAGRIVRENIFSFTAPEYRQRYAPWLFDASTYGAWRAAGGTGIQAVQAFLIAAALLMAYRAARLRAPAAAAFAVVLMGIGVVEPRAIPRPHLASLLCLGATMWLIERAVCARRATPMWWTVPLIAIWSNLHVEAAFGAVVVSVFALVEMARPGALLREEAKRALLIAFFACLATLANPYGIGLWQYLVENTAVTQMLEIAELQPPYLPVYRAFFLYLLVLVAVFALAPRGIRAWELLIVGLAAAAGFRYLRLTPLVFIVSAPVLARQLGELMARGFDRRAVVVTAMAILIAGARLPMSAYVSSWQTGTRAIEPPAFFSASAIDFIRRNDLHGPVFNSNNLGGYLAFNLYPQVRVFQDSRLQTYPPDHFQQILRASSSPDDWRALVKDVNWAVLSRLRPDALSGVGRFPASEWTTAFRDDAIEIVVRRNRASLLSPH